MEGAGGDNLASSGFDALNLFRAMEQGSVKVALIMCTNPGTTLPSSARYQAAMERCFTVVVDAVEDSETQRHAQVVLPAALWIEKEGVTRTGRATLSTNGKAAHSACPSTQ